MASRIVWMRVDLNDRVAIREADTIMESDRQAGGVNDAGFL